MATPKETIWEIDPHTIAKHKILENYLKAWFPILCSHNSRVNYIDGFAGPGKYSKEEPGSPIIALEVAKNHTAKLTSQINFIFIEEDKKRADHLEGEIQKLALPNNFKYYLINGEFHTETIELLNHLDSDKKVLAPTFAFIDPFGFSGIPFNVVERLLAIPKVEVFITFMVDSINRFIGDEKVGNHIVELFGSKDVEEIIKTSANRIEDLKKLYQSKLNEKSKYVRYFEMCDNNNRPIYDLFFGTNHELGLVRMKEAMWKVDEEGFYNFSDATNPEQILLFQNDYNDSILSLLKGKFGTSSKFDVSDIQDYIKIETPYLINHLNKTLRELEDKELIEIEKKKKDGKPRRKHTFPPDVILRIK